MSSRALYTAALLLICPPLQAEPPLREAIDASPCKVDTQYYSVNGSTGEELRRSMDEKGPVDSLGLRRDAYTGWHIYWSWPSPSGKPDFEKSEVLCDIKVTLPGLSPEEKVPDQLYARWTEFSARLEAHEANHVAYVSKVFPRIRPAILDAARRNPTLTAQQANDLAQGYLAEIRKLDRQYDERTRNGRLEGVRFP